MSHRTAMHPGPLVDGGLSKQRRGTDPSKYKTTICRNWEAHGVCNFRGCTFAHGNDELRTSHKTASGPTTPNVGPAQPSGPGSSHTTPQSGPQHNPPLPRSQQLKLSHHGATAGNAASAEGTTRRMVPLTRSKQQQLREGADACFEVSAPSPAASTSSHPTVQHVSPGASGGALPMYHESQTSSLGTSPQMGASAPPPPPPSYAMATASRRTGSPPPALSHMGVEQTLEALMMEVGTARELTGIHADANQHLESLVVKERAQRREAQERIRELKTEAARLRGMLERRRADMQDKGQPLPELAPEAARQPLNASAPSFVPTGLTPPMESTPASGGIPPLSFSLASKDREAGASNGASSLLNGASPVVPEPGASTTTQSTNQSITSPAGEASSGEVASPTDPVQQDRLRQLLDQLALGGDDN